MRIAETSLPQFPTSSPIPLPLPPSTTNMQLSAGTERTSHATCSISSSACDSDHSTPPIDRSPTRFKRRRRSRARPSPPITRVLALNKAHFKSVVHQFTDNDASPGKCLAPAPSLVPTSSLQPRRRPPAPVYHGPVPSSFAHCLNSTLRMLLSCVVEFVHGHSQNYAFATSSPVTTNAMALLQALCCSQAHGDERFMFDGLNGNEEIDDLGSLDFGLSSNWASSHEDLLGLS